MIFTALGLLVLAGAMLLAGIAKSSVLLLMLSLVSTVAAVATLAVAYSVARRTGLTTGALSAMPTPASAGAPPIGQPGVFMYVPIEQLPAMSPAAAAAIKVGGGNGKGGAGAVGTVPPIAGYDEMTADQVGALVASGALNDAQLQAVRDYEVAHAARKNVVDRIDKTLYQT